MRWLAVAVTALPLPQAWAQGVPADSVQGDTSRPAVLRVAGDAGLSARPADAAGRRTSGRLEVGGTYGVLPFSLPGGSPWNGYVKGRLGVELLGVPLAVVADAGTDVPVRGARNSVRLVFDAPRIADRERWSGTEELHTLRARLDSLEGLRASAFRRLKGLEARLAVAGPAVGVPGVADVSAPAVELPPGDVPVPPVGPAPPPLPPAGDTLGALRGRVPVPAEVAGSDSLRRGIGRAAARLRELEGLIARQQGLVQRATAAMNARRDKVPLAGRLLQGIRRLEVGSCGPSSSEFLVNGLNFQGVSLEYEGQGVFFSLDHGRSFDDAWLSSDPVGRQLELLHRSLLLADARELAPRRLTAVRGGVGRPGGTHFHVGYLHGLRMDSPPGMLAPPGGGPREMNRVVEVDLGYAVREDHVLRVVLARSEMRNAVEGGDFGGGEARPGDLLGLGGGRDQALKVGWSSVFRRTDSRVEVQGTGISPWFQSFGMGYVRNGSKRLEGRLEQGLGRKLRFQGRLSGEGREGPSAGGGTSITRAQARLCYRPVSSTTLRAGYLPVGVRTRLGEGWTSSANRVYTLGGDLRKRWRRTVVVWGVDLGLYRWMSGDAVEEAFHHALGMTVMRGESWQGRLSWGGLGGGAGMPAGTFSVSCGYRGRGGVEAEGALDLPSEGAAGWSASCSRPLGRRVSAGLRGASVVSFEELFSTDDAMDQKKHYNCALFMVLSW